MLKTDYSEIDYLQKYTQIIGCDEVGRGPIAGPVVGCAVSLLNPEVQTLNWLKEIGVMDSKKLSSKKRLEILSELGIKDVALLKPNANYSLQPHLSFVLQEMSAQQIDESNILKASLNCMFLAAKMQHEKHAVVLVDGNQFFSQRWPWHVVPIVKGDSQSVLIGLASIVAKEYRDAMMSVYDELYPGYGLAKHAGYPTEAHRKAVKKLGVSEIHRKSFSGVKEYVEKSE